MNRLDPQEEEDPFPLSCALSSAELVCAALILGGAILWTILAW